MQVSQENASKLEKLTQKPTFIVLSIEITPKGGLTHQTNQAKLILSESLKSGKNMEKTSKNMK
jgi:hypothetical protein